jgi:hypothetical protein
MKKLTSSAQSRPHRTTRRCTVDPIANAEHTADVTCGVDVLLSESPLSTTKSEWLTFDLNQGVVQVEHRPMQSSFKTGRDCTKGDGLGGFKLKTCA